MRRNIIKQGSAYTITLPISWCRDRNITEASTVDIVEEGNALHIHAKHTPQKKQTKASLKGASYEHTRITIENHYLMGYTQLKLTDVENIQDVRTITRNLIGFELVKEEKNMCTIQATSMPTQEEFATLLRRILHIIAYSFSAIRKQNEELTDQLQDVLRYSLYCTRSIVVLRFLPRETEGYAQLLLEKLIHAQETLTQLSKYKKRISKSSAVLLKNVQELYSQWQKTILSGKNDFTAIHNTYERWSKKAARLLDSAKSDSMRVHGSLQLGRSIFLLAQPRYSWLKKLLNTT